ncbi:hypothetical protein GJ633_13395 [Halorubrum sp. CBA1125]|uniref:hypothetical protein n=1 Tax=Halorubrum sp. CBA1125 TaxID=2668072 RepID=UPI0012E84B6E|nr:hypothetical protein [Halorubrum sp. CBA1125]MUW15512.1 hypothetical protein [Halorubrum sp. CBA1125]
MELTEGSIRERAREYAANEPLYDVERQHVATLPETLAGGEYGRRDVQWVVRWYFRRYLGDYPDRERREAEDAFADNDFGEVLDVLGTVASEVTGEEESPVTGEDLDAALATLTDLDGVDVPVATAFLQFLDPERFVAMDPRTWDALAATGALDGPYPESPSPEVYRRFDRACRSVMDRTAVDAWTLYRALWRAAPDALGPTGDREHSS